MSLGLATLPHITGGRCVSGRSLLGNGRPPSEDDPLPVEDVRSIYRLLRIIRTDLARRSAPLLKTRDFDRLERQLELLASDKISVNQFELLHLAFTVGLLHSAATSPELSTIISLSDRIGIHYQAGMQRLGMRPCDFPNRCHAHYAALEAFRTGDPELAAQAILEMTLRAESIVLWLTRKDLSPPDRHQRARHRSSGPAATAQTNPNRT
jgi:DNA-binding GntR family transcriptional regulator